MKLRAIPTPHALAAGALALALLAACGSKSPPATESTASATAPAGAAAPAPADMAAAAEDASQPLEATATTWTPEALEDLLAPVALYPDAVLMQVLVVSTNPQEVLDAGNWLIANATLTGKAQDQAAEKAGFTVPMRAVMQSPDVVDTMCLNMPWTEEMGQAYVNDQQGVMDAVQRLRVQARDVGTLQSSPQMKVATVQEPGQAEVITVSSPNPQVVYVPQYDPQAAYAPPAAAAAPAAAAPAATTTTTESKGHSTGSLVATGLLSFGAGLLVSEIFDDDDDWYDNNYYGGMWYRPMPYYPPYPYRPVYGGGFYPGYGYNRPPNYIHGGNTVIINQNNNYYDRYKDPRRVAETRKQPRSPISAARPNRPELKQLNAKADQGPARRAPAASEAWKGKGGYAGADPKVRQSIDKQAAKADRVQADRGKSAVQGSYAGAKDRPAAAARPTPTVAGKVPAPKVQGGYAGAKPSRDLPAKPAARPDLPSRDAARPEVPKVAANRPSTGDRGRPQMPSSRPDVSKPQVAKPAARPDVKPAARPTPQPAQRPAPQAANRSAMAKPSGGGGNSAKAASARGKQSMPSGGAAKARAGGAQKKAR